MPDWTTLTLYELIAPWLVIALVVLAVWRVIKAIKPTCALIDRFVRDWTGEERTDGGPSRKGVMATLQDHSELLEQHSEQMKLLADNKNAIDNILTKMDSDRAFTSSLAKRLDFIEKWLEDQNTNAKLATDIYFPTKDINTY